MSKKCYSLTAGILFLSVVCSGATSASLHAEAKISMPGGVQGIEIAGSSDSDTVQINDVHFLEALIGNWVDSDGNGVITYGEASAVFELWISYKEIVDLTGIEAFDNLEMLNCQGNQLTSLDLSKCTSLSELRCAWNQLSALDLSSNGDLSVLDCRRNEITDLKIDSSKYLVYLECSYNLLSNLDVSHNTLLKELYCGWNRISHLELAYNQELRVLYCSSNLLSSLDISNNHLLEEIKTENMSDLSKVCVWTLPFPPDSLDLYMAGSKNIYFTTACGDMDPPELEVMEDSLYRPGSIDVISSEDGMIYLVPENTPGVLTDICELCMDSVPAFANESVSIPVTGLSDGTYWLYARDNELNVSDLRIFRITGVGTRETKEAIVHMYPNPVSDVLRLEFTATGPFKIEVLDMNGRSILRCVAPYSQYTLDLSMLPKGLYLVSIRSKEESVVKRFIRI